MYITEPLLPFCEKVSILGFLDIKILKQSLNLYFEVRKMIIEVEKMLLQCCTIILEWTLVSYGELCAKCQRKLLFGPHLLLYLILFL